MLVKTAQSIDPWKLYDLHDSGNGKRTSYDSTIPLMFLLGCLRLHQGLTPLFDACQGTSFERASGGGILMRKNSPGIYQCIAARQDRRNYLFHHVIKACTSSISLGSSSESNKLT